MPSSENVFLYFPSNRGWSHQLIRIIGEAQNGGGDFGEIHRAASKMRVGDENSWFSEWSQLAAGVEEFGKTAEEHGFSVSAMQAYFRASNYYRMADFYLDRDDSREIPTYLKHVSLFQKAAALRSPNIEQVSIPFEAEKLHGYFIHASPGTGPSNEKRHCVIIFGGADATCEEAYFSSAVDASLRGFHVIIMDGPGQGYTLRMEKLYTRFDYEKAVAAAIDFIISNMSNSVDANRIGLMGRSMGGYYAARTAAMEGRIKAAVVFDAVFNVLADVYDFFPPIRRAINWDLGVRTDEEAREKLANFNLAGIAEKTECPMLIIHGEDDYVTSPDGARKLYAALKQEDKTLKWYKAGHGVSAFKAEATAYLFDWFREKL